MDPPIPDLSVHMIKNGFSPWGRSEYLDPSGSTPIHPTAGHPAEWHNMSMSERELLAQVADAERRLAQALEALRHYRLSHGADDGEGAA